MGNWIIGTVLAVVALVLAYLASALGQGLLLLLALVAVVGIFALITFATRPSALAAAAATASAAPVKAAYHDPDAFRGTGATLGVVLIGLVGLLVYISFYILGATAAQFVGWVIYLGLALTATMMVVVIILTAGKAD